MHSICDIDRLPQSRGRTHLGLNHFVCLERCNQRRGVESVQGGRAENTLCGNFLSAYFLRSANLAKLQTHTETRVFMMSQASETMGIPAPGSVRADGQSTFSDDVFRIELCGPNHSHLSVIDVHGIFRIPTEGLTTKDDMLMVRSMVRRFIANTRTIILAVLPANVDIATQEILDMADEVDRSGQRKLGVLTKPDLVDKGAERDVMDLVRGKRNVLKLAYCMVRNRGQQEKANSSIERQRTETEFFDTEPFSSLPKDRVGISALRSRLRNLLREITRREFPNVKREIAHSVMTCEDELHSLGPSRETYEQQRKFLLDMVVKFQETVSCALEARYGRNEYLRQKDSIRLATVIVDFYTAFSEDMEKRGHTVQFSRKPSSPSVQSLPRKFKLKARHPSISPDDEAPSDSRERCPEMWTASILS